MEQDSGMVQGKVGVRHIDLCGDRDTLLFDLGQSR